MVVTDTDWEDFDDLDNFGISICLSTGRPTAHEGRHIYETDTNKTMRYTGAAWVELAGGGGVTDHGALTGLADDDHTQYVLVNGTRVMTGDLTINKVGPKFIAKPTDSDSPALILEDTSSNYKGRVYVTGDDMVVLGEDGELYLSTAVTTGGNVLLETKGVTRLTVADTGLTSTVPIAMGTNKVTGLAAATANGDALRYEQLVGAYLPLTGGTLTGDLTINKTNPYLIVKPTDATSPAILLRDSSNNNKGRVYVTGDDMVVRPDDGHLYISTSVTTGGNVLLETKGVTRLTIADALMTASIPLSMGTNKITNVVDPTANQEAATKKYVDDTAGISDHSLLSNLTWSTAGHTINANIDMNDNNITEANEIQATASQNLTLKVSTGSSIVFQAV